MGNSHKKVILSAIAASFIVAHGGGYAQDIQDDKKLVQDAQKLNNYTYQFSTGDVIKTELGKTHLSKDDKNKIKHLTITAAKGQTGSLKFEGTTGKRASIGGDLENGYSFNLTADSVMFQGQNPGDASIVVGNGHGVINAKNGVTMTQGTIELAKGSLFK